MFSDTLKINVQLHDCYNGRGKLTHAFRDIIKSKGFVRGMYGGFSANLMFIVPEKTVKFVVNNRLKEWLRDDCGKLDRKLGTRF